MPAYTNSNLFADHFLETRLSDLDDWKAAQGVDEAFRQIRKLYQDRAAHFDDHTNEAQTEEHFIRPVLHVLWGDGRYEVQPSIPNVDGTRRPDYAFFRSEDDLAEARKHPGTADFWRDVPCLGDAKPWAASLDKVRGVQDNPTAQVCSYLYRSRVRWGILTSGRRLAP